MKTLKYMYELLHWTCYVPFATCARLQTGTSHLLPVEHKRALYKRDANGTSRLFSVRLQCPFAPLARVEQTGTPPGHKREVPVCIACKFRADKFFRKRTSRLLPTRRENAAQGDSTCGERRISLALAGVGAHFCHVATSSLPKIRRAVPICVADANGQGPVCAETHLCSSTNGQCPSVGRSCGRAPRILSLSLFKILTPTLQNLHTHTRTTLFTAVGPSKARSFTESRVGAQTGHDCKAPWCACANGHSALTATFKIFILTPGRHVHIRKRALRCEEHKRAQAKSARLQTGTRHKRDITDGRRGAGRTAPPKHPRQSVSGFVAPQARKNYPSK
jgi:hypothetical protein